MHIELNDLSKRFGRTTALDHVDLNVPPSSIIAVLGENGAGKSTLLSLLGGVLAPDQGLIRYDGQTFSREKLELRKRLLFTPDVPFMFMDRSIAANIATFASLYDARVEEHDAELTHMLEETSIAALLDRSAGSLSRGQLWKAFMACVTVVRPELWLVDEPFASGMDVIGMGVFRRLARKLADTGGTLIYTTQMVDLAAEFSDHVCVLRQGHVVLWETSTRVREMIASAPEGQENVLRGLR
ncbi:ABC transporter ATP-binding protein [Prosthecobacter sp.]|uniref:ABC transporter ATP-binding protein n=1 Tax=Prosthecobacter sp. TaxID=1965333 RepID=UPI002ABBBAB0|nr:ABC transporter ATP-binding protein [Prosthecobacter sp.]MDZ4403314.1 ABC transporter ATP-binding protein [Prosthecobacter sp.]